MTRLLITAGRVIEWSMERVAAAAVIATPVAPETGEKNWEEL